MLTGAAIGLLLWALLVLMALVLPGKEWGLDYKVIGLHFFVWPILCGALGYLFERVF